MDMPRLIVNADDFGLSVAINRGIAFAHRCGTVTSTTLLINGPAVAHAMALARRHRSLSVGLHLNLTEGACIAGRHNVRSLVDDSGCFRTPVIRADSSPADVVRRAEEEFDARVDADDVRREFAAQLRGFQEVFDHLPTHLDSHQHVHRRPAVIEPFMELAVRHHLPVRSIDETTRARARQAAVPTPATLLRCRAAVDPERGVVGLLDMLATLSEDTAELMCHPGFRERSQEKEPAMGTMHRAAELRVLTDARVMARLRPIVLSYAALTRADAAPPHA